MPLSRRRVAVGLAVAALVGLGFAVSPARALDALHAVLYSRWFPVVLAGLYLVRPFLAWPIAALAVLVGYRYGVTVGVPLALAATVSTSLIPFVGARRFRPEDGAFGRVTAGSRRFFEATGNLRGVVAARLAPAPTEAVSVAAGLAGVSLPAFVAGTAVGQLPWTVAAVAAGHSMEHLSTGGLDAVSLPLVVAGAALAVALVAAPVYRYVTGERVDVEPAVGE
jgi:uncharacterized membrane protein YdjX (TVP38/TMEM64 family)